MGCDAGRACIHDHVRPWLNAPKISDAGDSYRALAPCHADRTHSLSVSIGATGRAVWCCHACQKRLGKEAAQAETRNALIRSGVPAGCLRRPADDAARFEEVMNWLTFGKDSSPHKVLRLAAYLRGYGYDLPGGEELRSLAEDCGVSLAEAYRARGKNR
jgi:hypothetical protein